MNYQMDAEKAKMSLTLAVTEAFEVIAFMDVAETELRNKTYDNMIQIDISHPFQGSIIFFLMNELKNKIIENVYGEDAVNLNEYSADDCLLEILNVIAGNFMTFYFGNNTDYKMVLPIMIMEFKEPGGGYLVNNFFSAEGLNFRIGILCD